MKEIDEICIVFENVESMSIPAEYIKFLIIDDIKESVAKLASNYIAMFKTCKNVLIHISKDAEKCEFIGLSGDPLSLNRLIDYNNIASIELFTKGEHVDTILPTWNDESEYYNANQKTTVIEGDIIISVTCTENKSFNDYIVKCKK